ncbi:hypothetical protein DPMN_026370 [Dreissena polymorpha]|uniref:Uncharacterized protein n=1 Tax=Dreissena polymorpha TaxID=45954 RepID=A0A9D4REH7_DREPO|nr:hypothetical protein DPMN_026370 [Dreissena polymorpha]
MSTVIPDSISEVEAQAGVRVPDEVLLSYALSSKDWIQAQSNDPVISVVIDHVHKGTRPSASRALGTNAVDKYRRDWDKLELRNGVLYRKCTLLVNSIINWYCRLHLEMRYFRHYTMTLDTRAEI